MLKVVNLIAIRRGCVLIACSPECQGNFPGGKIDAGETPEQALRRELKEEIPGLKLGELKSWKTFYSVTPNSQKQVEIQTFFAVVHGSTEPAAELSATAWVKNPFAVNLTPGSQKIWLELLADGHLSG